MISRRRYKPDVAGRYGRVWRIWCLTIASHSIRWQCTRRSPVAPCHHLTHSYSIGFCRQIGGWLKSASLQYTNHRTLSSSILSPPFTIFSPFFLLQHSPVINTIDVVQIPSLHSSHISQLGGFYGQGNIEINQRSSILMENKFLISNEVRTFQKI